MTDMTQKYLKSILHYRPMTGVFTWIKSRQGVSAGSVIDCIDAQGYVRTRIDQRPYHVHRLAFLYMTGEWPKDQVDHINRIRNDNRWCNLRDCTRLQNLVNSTARKNNTSGYKGVSWQKRREKWTAQIHIKGKNTQIGLFDCKHEAARAYNDKALEVFGEFAYLNKERQDNG